MINAMEMSRRVFSSWIQRRREILSRHKAGGIVVKGIYLCGPIQNRSDEECVLWRSKATALLDPLPVLNPIRRNYRGRELDDGIAAEVVEGDIDDISKAACLLVMFDRPSVGTAMEIRAAYMEYSIPVFVVDISDSPRSPWLIYHTTQFFGSLEDACAFISGIYFFGREA